MVAINNSDVLFNNFLKTAENIINYYDDNKDERNRILAELDEVVKESCGHEDKIRKINDTIRQMHDDDVSDLEKSLKNFQKKKKELLKYTPNVEEDSNFVEFKRQVEEIVGSVDGTKSKANNLSDDDIEFTQDDINIIDPFTKKRMIDPVKNKVCGHVYERTSAVSMIEANNKTKCPVIGCINKNPILMENLVSDMVTKRYLQQNPA
ncbi:E3 SUMO-protein ligase NSE2-like [Trichogramma pretiosum]|uniref:E3 SUMO-protein ligase NSE2 n=1 Tax=Trichogramma kaykai TaxID=54128 RepID=A0ABD2XN73_9HYME|nr:E3 SUMO-protein ligase NSE2-like [Trichogramma pretiosum]